MYNTILNDYLTEYCESNILKKKNQTTTTSKEEVGAEEYKM